MTELVVDIHTHLYPDAYLDALRARAQPPRLVPGDDGERFLIFPGEAGRVIGEDYRSVARKLAFMERFGIAQSVVSLGNPWLDPLTGADTVAFARELNARFADLRDETAGRIVGFGVLPAGDVGAAAEIAGEIAQADGLYGAVAGTRICGRRLDDDALDPLWAVLESTRLPLLIHPHHGLGLEDLDGFDHALPVGLAFPFETTAALSRMIFGGVWERFPGLKVVASHGGGTLPFLAGRLDAAWRSSTVAQSRLPVPPSERLRGLFLDALTYHPRALRATAELVGAERMGFGSDHPFSVSDPAASLAAVRAAFQGESREAVLHRSAIEYFGLPLPAQATATGRR